MGTANERKKELQSVVKDMLSDPIIVIGYMEHQIDLMGKIIEDLSGLVDTSTLAPAQQQRLTSLKSILQFSSLDFENLNSPLQSYKIPKVIELKEDTRRVQTRYLNRQIQEGLM